MRNQNKVGKYVLSKTIGQGTFGKVKLALHSPTNEKVAIKILEKKKLKDSSDIERISREIKILKKLSHQNIVQLYEVIETSECILLILEYACGGELFDYIVAHGRLSEEQAVRFYHQILDATEYIHQHKVVHRDLKPENLLLDEKNNIKLADFGLSNTYINDQEMDTPCGSPCYAAPEMVSGKSYKGLSVDIWSSGVVLYAMVCGFLPFEDPSTPILYQKIISGKYEEPEWLSEEVKDLMKKIMNTNPLHRYGIEDIRRHPWMAKGRLEKEELTGIDESVIRDMASFGAESNKVMTFLEGNLKNSLTTLYFLLAKRKKSIVPKPPDTLSNKKIQKMQKIRYIETRKESRPVSRIKITAKSVTPKTVAERVANSRTRVRRIVHMPKEPEVSSTKVYKRNSRIYKPIQTNNKLNFSYKITPRNYENSSRTRNFHSFLTPKS